MGSKVVYPLLLYHLTLLCVKVRSDQHDALGAGQLEGRHSFRLGTSLNSEEAEYISIPDACNKSKSIEKFEADPLAYRCFQVQNNKNMALVFNGISDTCNKSKENCAKQPYFLIEDKCLVKLECKDSKGKYYKKVEMLTAGLDNGRYRFDVITTFKSFISKRKRRRYPYSNLQICSFFLDDAMKSCENNDPVKPFHTRSISLKKDSIGLVTGFTAIYSVPAINNNTFDIYYVSTIVGEIYEYVHEDPGLVPLYKKPQEEAIFGLEVHEKLHHQTLYNNSTVSLYPPAANCSTCVGLKDPRLAWHKTNNKCVPWKNEKYLRNLWQDIEDGKSECAFLKNQPLEAKEQVTKKGDTIIINNYYNNYYVYNHTESNLPENSTYTNLESKQSQATQTVKDNLKTEALLITVSAEQSGLNVTQNLIGAGLALSGLLIIGVFIYCFVKLMQCRRNRRMENNARKLKNCINPNTQSEGTLDRIDKKKDSEKQANHGKMISLKKKSPRITEPLIKPMTGIRTASTQPSLNSTSLSNNTPISTAQNLDGELESEDKARAANNEYGNEPGKESTGGGTSVM